MFKCNSTKKHTIKPTNRSICYNFILLMIIIIISSCQRQASTLLQIKIEETQGLNRPLEYVEISLPDSIQLQKDSNIYVYSKKENERIRGQMINGTTNIVFPISIKPYEIKEFIIQSEQEKEFTKDTDLTIIGDSLNVIVENDFYSASFKEFVGFGDEKLGAGHLGNLKLKKIGNQVLARKNPNLKIHWAPNFSKEKMRYKTMAHITSPDSCFISKKGPHYFTISRSGHVEGYEKILLKGKYKAYAGLPYFIFKSEIYFKEDDTLNLLRNDEMTLDSLFTNVVFTKSNGKIMDLPLYDEATTTYLNENPITDKAPWLFFYNKEKSYAFGSIRLQYNNKNIYGDDSPTENKHTKITQSINSGRYWNRRLIDSKNTIIPKGSRYQEENAYIVFTADDENPAKKIEYYNECLRNPVKVIYMD